MKKIKGAFAAATLAALALLAVVIPANHAHWLTERSLAAHEHFQNPEAFSEGRCGERVHLDVAIALEHEACFACRSASPRARPASSAGTSPAPSLTGLELPKPGLIQKAAMGLPEGRAPPLT